MSTIGLPTTSRANKSGSINPCSHFNRSDSAAAGVDVDVDGVVDVDVDVVVAVVAVFALSAVATTAHHLLLSSGQAQMLVASAPSACGLHALFEGHSCLLSSVHAGLGVAVHAAVSGPSDAHTIAVPFWPSAAVDARARQKVQFWTSLAIPAFVAAANPPTSVSDAPSA